MKIAIISTGNELLRGAIADTNAAWIASRLHELGLDVSRITVAPDDHDELVSVFRQAYGSFDLLIVGGGLGPTIDDITARAAAEAADLPLVRSDDAVRRISAVFERLGKNMNEINLKQADLPRGCEIVDNPVGTAPGFALRTGRAHAFFLPGVPREMKPMFENCILPTLEDQSSRQHTSTFKCFGMGESDIQAALTELPASHPGIELAFRPSFPEISITFKAPNAATLDAALAHTRQILKGTVFAWEDIDIPTALGRALLKKRLTMAVAESCTGGLIGHEITQAPGSSAYFKGAVVSYDNDVKIDLLGVDRQLILDHGAVSAQVATAMVKRARILLHSDIALATSGVAGPGGGTEEKPVGLVHIAVAHGGGIDHREHRFKGYDRASVKKAAAWTAMRMALNIISEER